METISTVQVQVISKEILKPSSQTPNHLKNHKLSAFDQLGAPVYIPLVFFYQADDLNGLISCDTANRAQISQKLKKSLSDTLTAFYPLAGKLDQENFMVDCDDSGVMYVEARVHARVSGAIQDDHDTPPKQLKMYLPVSTGDVVNENILLAVQINFFDCGGIAVGLCLSHQIADGMSAAMFMNSWAATCRSGEVLLDVFPKPRFDLADHFPARDLSAGSSNIVLSSLYVPEDVFVMKRFVFDKEKMAALRELAAATNTTSSSESNVVVLEHPSRVQLVSAFIWKYFIQAAAAKSKKIINTSSAAIQAVNLRNRMVNPPHDRLEHVFGNFITLQAAIIDYNPEIHDLVCEFRNIIRAVNEEYIRKPQSELEGDHGHMSSFGKALYLLSKGALGGYCGFSSWCRFPVYEVDYGWGKPVWVGTIGFSLLNTTILMDTPSGDGVEAYINTLPDDMESLESQFKLL